MRKLFLNVWTAEQRLAALQRSGKSTLWYCCTAGEEVSAFYTCDILNTVLQLAAKTRRGRYCDFS